MGTIYRKALSRAGFLGSLYNAKNNQLCGISLLRDKTPLAAIDEMDIPETYLIFVSKRVIKKRFKLNVEAQLKLSVLAGLITLEGSGKYLSNEKKSSKSIKSTLVYRTKTKEVSLNFYHDDLNKYIVTEAFQNQEATHIVIGIKWGAYVLASFELKEFNSEDKKDIKGNLKAYL